MKNQIKQNLFNLIKITAKHKNLSQRELGKVLKVSQPRVSNLLNERTDLFSIDSLIDFVDALGYNADINITEKETA